MIPMYVCLCSGITDKQIRRAIADGAGSLQALRDQLGVASQCGGCAEFALALLDGSDSAHHADESLFYSPA
jgi:bacterioferritin-associated ferredoxin